MEPLFIEIDGEDFIIHFVKEEGNTTFFWNGTASQIQKFADNTWLYQSRDSSDFTSDIKEARVWFEWSYCWRGIWEGRIYFKDDEYWCEEMDTIPKLWNSIEVAVKAKIILDNPEYDYFK